MNNENENLDNLLEGFYSPEQASQFKQDMQSASDLLAANPAPNPSDHLINKIKTDISKTQKHHHLRYTAAAAILILLSLSASIYVFNKSQDNYKQLLSDAQWQSSDLSLDDTDLLEMQTALNNISDQLENFDQFGYSELSQNIDQLESDFTDLEENFWKG